MYEALIPPMQSLLKLIGTPFKPFLPLVETPEKAVLGGIGLLAVILLAVRILVIVA